MAVAEQGVQASIRQRLPSDALVAVLALTAWARPRPAAQEPG